MTEPFETDLEKAEALDFSRPLDVHRWSDYPEVNAAVNAICTDLKNDPDFTGNETLKKKHIKVIVLDLYVAWLTDPALYLAYHRDKSAYNNKSRYNGLHISFLSVSIIDALQRRRYIDHHLGHYGRDGSWSSHLSRMKATDKLIKLVKDDHKVTSKAIKTFKNTETIILRDWVEDKDGNLRKRDIEYTDTRETNRMRKELGKYNALINATTIEIPGLDGEVIEGIDGRYGHLVNYPENRIRRIFNNGTWSEGGRYYGGWWQSIPGKIRRQIRIDNSSNPCSEIDYSGLHIIMLYAIEGIDYWQTDGIDPYKLDGIEQSERMRQLLKQVLLIAINAKTKKGAVSAIRQEINFDDSSYGWTKEKDINISELIDAFANRHSPIQHHLFSGSGIKLQNIDSKIAETIINHFTNKEIVTLCIHDSFLIDPLYENELNQLMTEAFSSIMKFYTDTGIDIDAMKKHQSMYSDALEL